MKVVNFVTFIAEKYHYKHLNPELILNSYLKYVFYVILVTFP